MANILAYSTWSEVSGREMTLKEISDRFSQYPLPVVLGVLQRIDYLLTKSHRPDSPVQDRIGVGLMGERRWWRLTGAVARASEAVPDDQRRPLFWFHQLVLNAGKMAFLASPESVGRTRHLRGLGEAILGLSDHVAPQWDDSDETEIDAQLRFEFTLNGALNEKERVASILPLGRRVYMQSHPELRSHPHWVDLSDLFHHATGLSPERFLQIAMVAWGSLEQQDPSTVHEGVRTLNLRQILEGKRIQRDELEAFLTVMARTPDSMRDEVARRYSLKDLKPFSFVPFAETPLIAHADHQFCVSFKLFLRRITTDLHFFYLQHLPPGDRVRYLQFHGVVFEEVVHDTMQKACRRRGKGRNALPLTRYRRVDEMEGDGQKRADGVAQVRDVAVVLDAKAGRIPSPALQGNPASLDEFLQRTFIGAARQLDATIGRLRSGALQIGRMPRPKKFLPIVVTSQSMGWNAALDRFVAKRLIEEQLLQGEDVGPLMPVGLESLLILADKQPPDFSFVKVLEAWSSSEPYRFTSFHNFLVALGDEVSWEIPALRKETQEAFKLALEVFDPKG